MVSRVVLKSPKFPSSDSSTSPELRWVLIPGRKINNFPRGAGVGLGLGVGVNVGVGVGLGVSVGVGVGEGLGLGVYCSMSVLTDPLTVSNPTAHP